MRFLLLVWLLFTGCMSNREPMKGKNKDQFLLSGAISLEKAV